MVSREGSGDLEQWRVILKQETQHLRDELLQEMRQFSSEHLQQPDLGRLLSGNVGQVRVPPELVRNLGCDRCQKNEVLKFAWDPTNLA